MDVTSTYEHTHKKIYAIKNKTMKMATPNRITKTIKRIEKCTTRKAFYNTKHDNDFVFINIE